MKQYLFRKPDMDTCLTAFLLGCGYGSMVLSADEVDLADCLADSTICCIEAGGSGHVHLLNFDHHEPGLGLAPACHQAYNYLQLNNLAVKRLVDYVCMVDDHLPGMKPIEFPSLSAIFSGMLLSLSEMRKQFFEGIEIMRTVLAGDFDPFVTIPTNPAWQPYIEIKKENWQKLQRLARHAHFEFSAHNRKVGVLEVPAELSSVVGGSESLYRQGCEVVILFNPAFGLPPVRKFTIASQSLSLAPLLSDLNQWEDGWGGRDTIIGSPWLGSQLTLEQVVERTLALL
jgi:hypothetical protein